MPLKTTMSRARAFLCLFALSLLASLLFASPRALGQASSGYSNGNADAEPNPSKSIKITSPSNQSPFSGSVSEGSAKPEVVSLTFQDAIDLGLKNNLGVLLQSYNSLAARGEKWKELSELLPNVNARISENVVQDNLAARGLRFPGFPVVIGPYGFTDARVYLSQSILNLKALNRERGAAENERAAQFSYKDARELVVLATGNAYLQALSGASRVETTQAQLESAQALYTKAADQQNAGLSPAIDTLRARVEFQNRQQQLIVARNEYAKQKLVLVRAIGLPTGQEIELTSKAPYDRLVTSGIEESLQRAYSSRSDYLAAAQQVRAAEHYRRGATAEHYPTLDVLADYGALGINVGSSHGTFSVAGRLNIPIFQGGKAHADVLQAEATLRQAKAQLDNLHGQIEYEIRTALLDIAAADEQVEVARSSVDLAEQTLTQARDRFSAGVTDNLEVVQAQQTVASAHESYISSLYAHNLAKIELVRAMGYAEQGVRQYLKSK